MLKRLKNIENKLKDIYKALEVNGENCFLKESGEVIHLFGMEEFNALCIEYAENIETAKKNLYEDGDLFYIDEMNEEEMLTAMLREIEQDG